MSCVIQSEFLAKVLKNDDNRKPLDDCAQRINSNNLHFAGKTKRKMDVDVAEYENDVFAVQSLPDFPLIKPQNVLFRRTFSEIVEPDHNAHVLKYSRKNNSDYTEIFIGDLSKAHALPIMTQIKEELVYITPETMADVLENRACLKREEITIIDCRYPYEFNGGHIQSAINIYTKQAIVSHFINNKINTKALVFHCEFSQIRGPALARYLRNRDRSIHFNKYPKLFYPEIYVLFGGYRDFYQNFPHMCTPMNYVTMNDVRFSLEYARFRRLSKFAPQDSKSAAEI